MQEARLGTRSGGNATRITNGRMLAARALVLLTVMLADVTACGRPLHPSPAIPRALLSQARPIGAGSRFHPPAAGPVTGPCRPRLGARVGVHVEVFAANRVLLLPAGIGTRPPRQILDGQVIEAQCYGQLVTLAPTGLVLIRPGAQPDLGTLFRSWGQPLSSTRLASFTTPAGTHVKVFVDGLAWHRGPGTVPLTAHAEIVLEEGPYVPPHLSYAFPPGT